MELQKYIDTTNLKMDATSKTIEKLCNEAIEYGFHAVCVHPSYVSLAKELLKKSNVNVCTVIGFPLGMNTPKVKVFEAVDALENGAEEFDMVINVGALKDKDYEYVKREIEEVRDDMELEEDEYGDEYTDDTSVDSDFDDTDDDDLSDLVVIDEEDLN